MLLTIWEIIKNFKLLWIFIGIILLINIIFEIFLPNLILKFKNKFKLGATGVKCYEPSKPQPTQEARKLGEFLMQYGHVVEFEKWDCYKHIDIAIEEPKIYIEVDGKHHNLDKNQALRDLMRTYYSFKDDGYITLRIPNVLTRDDETIKITAEFINKFLEESNKQFNNN